MVAAPGALEDLACLYAMLGEPERALSLLRNAANHGWSRLSSIDNDPDLESVRALPEFQEVRALIVQNEEKPQAN